MHGLKDFLKSSKILLSYLTRRRRERGMNELKRKTEREGSPVILGYGCMARTMNNNTGATISYY